MKKCFTLVEVLTVIGIICILAALMLPALSKARGKARGTSCANNIRNVNIGFMMYADDYNDYAMPAKWGKAAGENAMVDGQLFKDDNLYYYCFNPMVNTEGRLVTPSYARSKGDAWSKIIACPELLDPNEYDGDRLLDRPKIGIAYNGGIGKTSQYDMGWHRIVEPSAPARFVTHMDRILRSRVNGSWSVAPYYSRPAGYNDGYGENVPLEELKLEFTRHVGYVNVAFADGHVAFNATWEQFDECAGLCYDKETLGSAKFQMNLVPTPLPSDGRP